MAQATIVYHQGTETVEDFHSIIEMDNGDDLRVWYSDPDGQRRDYVNYHYATIVEVVA